MHVESSSGHTLAHAGADARAEFITKTYLHLFGAVITFTLIEVALFKTGTAEKIVTAMAGVNWLIILGGFMVVSWIANSMAHRSASLPAQYAGLAAYVAAISVLFVPMLYVADRYAPGAISSAAVVTMAGFTGLTIVAFWTRRDFSFLGGIIRWGFILALVAIAGSILFGFRLGTFFSIAMVGLAGGAILYDTSNIIRHYPTDRYVGAALQLFASVAILFWYVLRIFLAARD